MEQTQLAQKPRRGPKPTGKGRTIGMRLQPDEIAALDKLLAQQAGMSRAGLAAAIVCERLVELGLLREDPQ